MISIDEDLQHIIIVKDVKLRNKLLKELKEALLTSFDEKRSEAINKAIEYLVSVDDEKFSKKDAKKVNDILKKTLGQDLAGVLEKNVNDLSDKLFKSGISDVARSLKLKLSFDVVDSKAARILGEHTMFWILNYYSDHLQTEIDDILKGYYNEGKLIREVASDFATSFSDKSNRGFAYFEGLAEHTTYRVNELGKVSGFEKAEIEYYEIKAIIDDRTSDVCRYMDGVIFPVSEAIKFRDTVLKLKSPEEIKNFAPWRSASELLDFKKDGFPTGMAMPPYHWRCRTIIIAYFGGDPPPTPTKSVIEEEEILAGKVKMKVMDFEKKFIESRGIKLGNNVKGKNFGTYNPASKEINIKSRLKDPLSTFLHELGHAIDYEFLDLKDKNIFIDIIHDLNNAHQAVNIVKNRLSRYDTAYKDLTIDDVNNLMNGNFFNLKGKSVKFSRKYINYLTSRSEIFAEAYSQFRLSKEFKEYAVDYFKYFTEIIIKLKTKYAK